MAFWNKKNQDSDRNVDITLQTETWYVDRLVALAKRHEFPYEVIGTCKDETRLKISLPSRKIDAVLDLCDSPLGKKFM